MKSADSMSASLPAGAQCESLMPISWPWKTGRPWWPLWVMRAMALPGRSSRKTSNALRLVLGPRTWSSPLAMICSISSWRRSPFDPTSAKPAAKTTANLARAATASRRMGSGSPTRMATRSSGSSMSVSALAQGRPATTGRLGLTKCTVAPRSSAHTVIFWVSAVLGRALESDAPDDGHSLGAEEGVEIDGAEGGRAAGDIQLASVVRGPRCHVPPSCRAGTPVQFHICRRGHPDRARRSPAPPGEGPRGPSPYMTSVSVSIRLDARSSPVKAEFGRIVGPPSPPLR